MPQTHRRACALPLQRPRFEGGKCFAVLPNGAAQIHAIRTREIRTTIGSALSGLNKQAGLQTLGDALADVLMSRWAESQTLIQDQRIYTHKKKARLLIRSRALGLCRDHCSDTVLSDLDTLHCDSTCEVVCCIVKVIHGTSRITKIHERTLLHRRASRQM